MFNHQTTGCGDDGSNVSAYNGQSKYGADFLTADVTTDYLLLDLEMTELELQGYGVCYAGWDARGNNQGSVVGIHHPAGDVKKISLANNLVNFSTSHYEVDWDQGTTQGGSSGSPLFDNNHRVIGQVHYGKKPVGTDDCYLNKITGYGKLDGSFLNGLSFYLTPQGIPSITNRKMNTYCAGDDLGPGGSNGVPLSDCKDGQLEPAGFYVDGKQGLVEVCVSNPVTLSNGCSPFFYPKVRSVDGSYFFSNECSNIQSAGGYFSYSQNGFPVWTCRAYYAEIFISVTLVNSNTLAPVGPVYSKWQAFPASALNITSSGGSFQVSLGAFDLRSYLPSPYITFYSGQTYRVKLASSGYNGWTEYTNYIHFYEDNRTLNNTNITSNVYGKFITINNSTISADVVAEELITINPNSTLYAGEYRIDGGLNCGSFMRPGQPTNVTYSKGETNNSYQPVLNNRALFNDDLDEISNANFNIYPNPTTGIFNVNIENNGKPVLIEVYDILSKKVFSKNSTTNNITIKVTGQPKGVYFVKIIVGNKMYNEKIIYQ
ncbi:MAG: hypothetical protein COA97_13040 [Flavobacteriales bacterium]|nr:MAG: hypothetical protein COA97_13040 [Flavobacteriales bacterium]